MAERPPSVRGPLRPLELAAAAVLGGVTVALAVLGWILPHASAIQALGAVPMGLVAQRYRPRAVLAATVAGCVVSFLVAGTGPAYSVVVCAIVGGLVGDVKRRGRGRWTVVAATAVVAPALAGVADLMLLVFAASRKLTLDQIRNLGRGVTGVAGRLPLLHGAADRANHLLDTAIRDWWATVAVVVVIGLAASVAAAWVIVGAVLDRLEWMVPEDRMEAPDDPRPIAPLPVSLRDVHVRYPQAASDALDGVSFALEGPDLVALVGANGSGKSTLARVLAGRPPTAGEVVRAGAAGLGKRGGTAVISQRPESQVLGVRVADDVVWGLPADAAVDVEQLLDLVGLGGMAARETTTLSGGELQRLAVAAALARRPKLLLSDESTAMIDEQGRKDLTSLLARLPRTAQMAVVHVTHRAEEAAAADRVVRLAGGRLLEGVGDSFPPFADPGPTGSTPARRGPLGDRRAGVLVVEDVSHTYADGTPWAQPALHGINLSVGEGDGLLIVGGNGSGKSTLAWVLAGLLEPTSGRCLLDGRPVTRQVGAVALAFQHARLQLQRPTVRSDIKAAAGIGSDAVPAALAEVGLDAEFADRRIDQLSGGEMRRVALAGLLARRPRVLILDEPLAGLDPSSRAGLLSVLGRLRDEGLSLIVISHDLEGMGEVCDRTALLAQGRLQLHDYVPEPVSGGGPTP
ncbi:ATP-binding cassette domain-containing protein [Acidiferrimicrobium sp. IK]|uniref:ABC transporter ATP-binding protein n=1 Tax=Acidiferrimicrobium sp. IK TaxID=2871700 RepID=UPI0021CAE527|nr:ABC transporter ATP-binding protein [Acidiferrimicrobium sp. IK]MCU4184140.1 ATP-binding cassette domain-containing protein [Acidiferrimicrobium sp. IK]